MIPYNTNQEKLLLPEYGRLVHEMVKICNEVEDRELRNSLANSIVETMKSMTQAKGKYPDDRKFWDHLYLISGKKLDVDYPFGTPEDDEIHPEPQKIPYSASDFGMRHYGRILQKLVKEISEMPNSEDKDGCVELLSTHIKKLLVLNNTEIANDEKVFSDLKTLSSGTISVEPGVFDLPEFKEETPNKTQKRKKNR